MAISGLSRVRTELFYLLVIPHCITALLEDPRVSEETVEAIAGHVNRKMMKRYSHIRE
jgi:hypothetical protein